MLTGTWPLNLARPTWCVEAMQLVTHVGPTKQYHKLTKYRDKLAWCLQYTFIVIQYTSHTKNVTPELHMWYSILLLLLLISIIIYCDMLLLYIITYYISLHIVIYRYTCYCTRKKISHCESRARLWGIAPGRSPRIRDAYTDGKMLMLSCTHPYRYIPLLKIMPIYNFTQLYIYIYIYEYQYIWLYMIILSGPTSWKLDMMTEWGPESWPKYWPPQHYAQNRCAKWLRGSHALQTLWLEAMSDDAAATDAAVSAAVAGAAVSAEGIQFCKACFGQSVEAGNEYG